MARYHGNAGIMYGSTTGTGAAAPLVSLSAWTLDLSTDKVDVTSMGDLNKEAVIGLKNVAGTLSGFWDDSSDTLFDGSDSTDGVKLYLYPSRNAPTFYFYGPAWLDASIAGGANAAVTITGNFVAHGAWGRKP